MPYFCIKTERMQSNTTTGPTALSYTERFPAETYLYPASLGYGINIICTLGKAEISTGIKRYRLAPGTQFLLLPGEVFHITDYTDDFRARAFFFSEDLFHEAAVPIESEYIHYLHDEPLFVHTADSRPLRNAEQWLDMAHMLCEEKSDAYDRLAHHNFIQGFLISICRSITLGNGNAGSTRKEQLFRHFISLVRGYCREHHDAGFYADKLCISLRHLRTITGDLTSGKSPKQLIDEQLVAEIKALLHTSDLSVTEIAYRMNFPDQSYLSRFFKRHTGVSPYNYRAMCRIRH